MRLGDFGRIVCIAHDKQYPAAWHRTAAEVAAVGGRCKLYLNGLEEISRIGRHAYDQINDVPPPAGYPVPPGCWHHDRAFRAIVRKAQADGLRSVLVVEQDVHFTPAFSRVMPGLVVPEDWGLLYLGANHLNHPTEEAGPNLLRIHGSFCVHAVVIRDTAYDAILGLGHDGPMDWMIAQYLHPSIPCYAVYPAAAIQHAGYSDVWGKEADYAWAFESKGSNW